MNPPTKYVLLPLNYPFRNSNALSSAIQVAVANKRPLKMVHIVHPFQEGVLLPGGIPSRQVAARTEELARERKSLLQQLCRETLVKHPLLLSCVAEVRTGILKDELVKMAQQTAPEWIVMSEPDEFDSFDRVAESLPAFLSRKTTVPVMAVPETETLFLPKRISYLTMGDRSEFQGVATVARLARNFRATLEVIEVRDELPEDLLAELTYNKAVLSDLLKLSNLEYRIEKGDSVEEVLGNKPNYKQTDLLVMHHPERNLLQRIFLGSPARRVMEDASVPVAVL